MTGQRRNARGSGRQGSSKPARSGGGARRGGPKPGGARRGGPNRSGSGAPRSRGAGRTGPVRADGDDRGSRPKTLGGEQIEGRQAVRELLLAQRRRTREIWISSELEGSDGVEDIEALAHANRVSVSYVARKRLESTARSEAPQGVIAFAGPIPEADFASIVRRRQGHVPFIVAVDGVTDPGNLGAILRSCEGAGVDAVVVPRHRAVHVTPTVAKAAAGAVEHVPIAVVPGLPAALSRLRDAGVWIVGLDDAADRDLFELGDLASEPVCVVLGAEGAGLSRLVRERCDLIIAIPMLGRVGSLNVSAAAALAAYEIRRHRR